MKKDIKLLFNYIHGNDIIGYDVETLEDDPLFMAEVLKYSRDKKMYQFCSEKVKSDYNFIMSVIDTFQDDKRFVEQIARNFILKNNSIESLALTIKVAEITNDLSYKVKARLCAESILTEIKVLIYNETDPKVKRSLGMGYIYILDNYYYNDIIMKYFAEYFINQLFFENDFEKELHKRHHNFEEIEKVGINNYLVNYIKEHDEELSARVGCYLDLLDDVKHEYNRIKNNWDLYLYNLNQERVDLVYEKTADYINENELPYIVGPFDFIYFAVKELHYEDKYAEFSEIEAYVKENSKQIPDVLILDIIKNNIKELGCYNYVKNLIKKVYERDVIEDDIYYEEPKQTKAKILSVDFKNKN